MSEERLAAGPDPHTTVRVTLLRRRIGDHRIVQWSIAYIVLAYGIQDAVIVPAESLDWPHAIESFTAKFARAANYAPNWGRLHLKWGDALEYAGKKDDAQRQLGKAAELDLSAADKVQLATQMQE